MIPWEDAVRRIEEALEPLPVERVALGAALGRALAEDLVSDLDLPASPTSAMDGWAVRAADVPAAGTSLPAAGERAAGSVPGAPLSPGTTARIFTGAPLPPGADTVVKQEDVDAADGRVTFRTAARSGDNVRAAGEDARRGETLLAAGAELGPAELGQAAALGRSRLRVRQRPRVGLLASGDELLELDAARREGAIYESNLPALAAAVAVAGGVPVELGIARDVKGEAERLLAAAKGCDAVVTTGGASVGDRDLLRPALAAVGATELFFRVAIRPGKPFGLYRLPDGRPVFLLPGNPASALVTFELFVRPGLRRLAGLAGHGRHEVDAVLEAPRKKPADLALFLAGNVVHGTFRPTPFPGSGLTRSLSGQRALATLPLGRDRLEAGETVRCRLL